MGNKFGKGIANRIITKQKIETTRYLMQSLLINAPPILRSLAISNMPATI